jgi:hypothetical protein
VIHEIVHGEQISGGKYGLVAMGDCGDIEYPSPPVARGELAGRFQNCPRATALRASVRYLARILRCYQCRGGQCPEARQFEEAVHESEPK